MPDYVKAHEHRRTVLHVPRTNVGAWSGAAIAGIIVAVATALLAGFQTGVLKPPPNLEPYLPWVLFALTIVVTVGAAVGVPSLHPGLPMDQKHYGPVRRHDPDREEEQL